MVNSEVIGRVYLITNIVNGKQYIGQTKKPIQQRWKGHLNYARKGSLYALHNALRKYGTDNFTVVCVEEILGSHADLMAAEIRHIAQYGCRVPNGYNMTKGGDGIDLSLPSARERHAVGVAKRSENPVWVRRHLEASRRTAQTSEWRQAQAEGIRKRASNPEWLAALRKGIAGRTLNPKSTEALRRADAARSSIAKARDSLCSLKEADRRARRRVYSARHKAKKLLGSVAIPYLETPEARVNLARARRLSLEVCQAKALAKDALCTPEEAAKRVKAREVSRLKKARAKAKSLRISLSARNP